MNYCMQIKSVNLKYQKSLVTWTANLQNCNACTFSEDNNLKSILFRIQFTEVIKPKMIKLAIANNLISPIIILYLFQKIIQNSQMCLDVILWHRGTDN